MPTDTQLSEKLIEHLLDHNQKVASHLATMSGSLSQINDENQLHRVALNRNTEAVKSMVQVNNAFLKIFRWVIIVLIVALIVLAGAEKALEFSTPIV